MKQVHALAIAVALFISANPPRVAIAQGASLYSDKSLIFVCADETPHLRSFCDSYVRGVVEAWHITSVVGPSQYEGRHGRPPFCDRILKVSAEEWSNIVRRNLKSVKPGFASYEVMRLIHDTLCN